MTFPVRGGDKSERMTNSDSRGPTRIQAVAKMTGLSAATLRAWERRYGIPMPVRTDSRYRLYSANDVASIQEMRALCESGVSPSDAANQVRQRRARLAPQKPTDPFAEARARLLDAAKRFAGDAIDSELVHLAWAAEPIILFERVVEPLLVEVGEQWERGEVSIAAEHFLSERIESLLRSTLRMQSRGKTGLALLACVEGEQHVNGLLGLGLKLSALGLGVEVLGASTPPSAIEDVLQALRPRFVGLSCSITPPAPAKMFQAYARACGKVPWVVGGAGVRTIPDVIERAGGTAAPTADSWQRAVKKWTKHA